MDIDRILKMTQQNGWAYAKNPGNLESVAIDVGALFFFNYYAIYSALLIIDD